LTASLTSFATITAAAVQSALTGLSNVGAGNAVVTGVAGGPFLIVFNNALGPVTLAISTSTGGAPTITGGLWTPPGATEAGWSFGKNITTNDINIEEQSPPVARLVASSAYTFSGTILEASRANWQVALQSVRTSIAKGAGGSGQPAVDVQTMQDALTHYAVALESQTSSGSPPATTPPTVYRRRTCPSRTAAQPARRGSRSCSPPCARSLRSRPARSRP
jgi:hypothetical protein